MSEGSKVWIGADPGGEGNFGLAILQSDGTAYTRRVNCADDAVEVVRSKVYQEPGGVGVDAPLWWSSAKSSDRKADQWLRSTYGFSGGQVQTANSLRGAALVQGAMFVYRIRELFPAVGVTESHPKALLKALKLKDEAAFLDHYGVRTDRSESNEHERDAIVAAVSAREGFEQRWTRDLSIERGSREQNPSTYWLAPVHYFWPD